MWAILGHLDINEAIAYLDGQSIHPPAPDWNVAHFLTIAGTVKGRNNTLLWVGDTYPLFGWQGYHLQPAAAIAEALNRGDGYKGGIFLFIAGQHRESMAQLAEAQGFQIEVWNNGSPTN